VLRLFLFFGQVSLAKNGGSVPYPLIGITTARRLHAEVRSQIVITEAYVQAVAAAGGCPVMIPLGLSPELLENLLARLDGILFTGGGDIDPAFYGASPHPKVGDVDLDRDGVELYLLEKAVSQEVPFLGICRGLQLINVGLGGTLYADITAQRAGALRHDYYPDYPRDYLAHTVDVGTESRLTGILGNSEVEVNSLHHQGIDQLAPDLVQVAIAPDGIVEAVELPGHPFGLAVQWHPEWLGAHAPMRALFEAFVQVAESRRQK
jgi:putative glutamine amidotransferase